MPRPPAEYPITPDGRYFVVRGRLWRRSNPALPEEERIRHVAALMHARRAVAEARRHAAPQAERDARAQIDAAKHALGERGTPWWSDGAPDYNRKLVRNTPYRAWFEDPTRKEREGTETAEKVDSDPCFYYGATKRGRCASEAEAIAPGIGRRVGSYVGNGHMFPR